MQTGIADDNIGIRRVESFLIQHALPTLLRIEKSYLQSKQGLEVYFVD